MLTKQFQDAKPILEQIESHGHQAFFVGGCVRDLLLKRPIGDIDIATSARPEKIQKIFSKVILVGVEHGTVIVRVNDQSYEVTTFRVDGLYTDKRHPDSVEFIDQIDEDLKRRDFTINALAMDKNGKIIDLFDGKKDLQKKVIRTVGNGYERFSEDPLRIIRAVRFSSQLGFTIDHETIQQIIKTKQDIEGLAIERITNEIAKLFAGEFVNQGIKYMKMTKIDGHLPILKESSDIMSLIPAPLPPLMSFDEVIALFHLVKSEISIQRWVKEWKCSNKIKKEASILVWAFNYYIDNGLDLWLVYSLNKDLYEGFLRIVNAFFPNSVCYNEMEELRKKLQIQNKKELAINGNDLQNWFPDKRKGPWLKTTINTIEKKIVTGTIINTKENIKEWLKWNPPEIN